MFEISYLKILEKLILDLKVLGYKTVLFSCFYLASTPLITTITAQDEYQLNYT